MSIKDIEKTITEAPEEGSTRSNRPRRRGMGGKFSVLLLIVVIVLAVLYVQQRREVARLTDPVVQTEYAQKQLEKVIAELKRTVVIDEGEELKLLGVINDPATLKKDQPFYANVEQGDYVFLLSKTSRALIWRPGANKIVNFGVADTTQAQQNVQQPTTPVTTKPATTTDEE